MSMFDRVRFEMTTTAAGVACMVVAVVAAGFTLYDGLRLAAPPVVASGITALVFLVLALGLLLLLHQKQQEAERQEPQGRLQRWASLVGQIAGAAARGALDLPPRRRRFR